MLRRISASTTARLVTLVAVLVVAPQANAQTTTATIWNELGANSATNTGISQHAGPEGATGGPAVAVNPANGDVYVAWPWGDGNADEIYVKRWDGSTWAEVGAGSASGGISNSPTLHSEGPQIAVRASDGHVFVVWRESQTAAPGSDIFGAEFNGSSWQRLGPNNGQISDVSQGIDANARGAIDPQLILSNVFATAEMPIVAWRFLPNVGQGRAIYVKRWTGVAWVEMGAGSASPYQLPHTNAINPATGLWVLGGFANARGINADDGTLDRLFPMPAVAGPGTVSLIGTDHFGTTSAPRLIKNNFGRPAVVFKNGSVHNTIERYPHGLHVRSFIGDNSLPAYLAWEEVGRIETGQSSSGYTIADGELSAAWGENGTAGLFVAMTLFPSAAPFNRPPVLRVLQFVGTSWAPLGPDVASGQTAFPYEPSLVKDSTGRLVISRTQLVGGAAAIHVTASTSEAPGVFAWGEVGAGSATGLGISASPTDSIASDIAVDSRNGTNTFVVAWHEDPLGNTPQIFVRGTQPAGGGGAQAPGAPGGLTAAAAGNNVALAWAAPTTGGAPTTYIIEVGSAPGLADLANVATGNTATFVAAGGVANGTYFVRVRAANGVGTSGPSNEATLVVGGPLQGPPGPPTHLVVSSAGNTVTLSWQAPASGGTPTTYIIEAGSAPGLADLANFPTGGTTTTFAAGGVPDGTYYVRLRAANGAGASGPSNEAVLVVGAVSGTPHAPTGLTASWVAGTVTLTWTAPAGGGTPIAYIIDVGTAPGLADLASVSTGNLATTLTAANVGAGTYYVRVRAANASGTSGPSNEVVVQLGADACSGEFTVTLTWNTGSTTGSPTHVDLDLHVVEPDGTRVYWADRLGGRSVRMFGDNIYGFGPEVTCTPGAPLNGVYAIDVVAYSGDQWPTTATVTVATTSGSTSVATVFAAPDSGVARRVATVAFPSRTITPATAADRAGPAVSTSPK